jgi:hypothetical protein
VETGKSERSGCRRGVHLPALFKVLLTATCRALSKHVASHRLSPSFTAERVSILRGSVKFRYYRDNTG